MKLAHLTRRFVGSLSSAPPPPLDEAWALAQCLPGEQDLWRRLSSADRRHAIGVARRTAELLGGEAAAGRPVLAAALLHDVGKLDAGLGTFGRVGATVVGEVVGRDRAARSSGRVGRYLSHDEGGAELLTAAGSHPLTVAWARQHHLPEAKWTVPGPVGRALKAADDD